MAQTVVLDALAKALVALELHKHGPLRLVGLSSGCGLFWVELPRSRFRAGSWKPGDWLHASWSTATSRGLHIRILVFWQYRAARILHGLHWTYAGLHWTNGSAQLVSAGRV